MGEKFAANPVTGTGSMTVPIATSPGRSGFGPQLALVYDSGSGNGPFGFGWSLSLPVITRKTDQGLPKYQDADESDVFLLSGAEDLVPVFLQDANGSGVSAGPDQYPFDEFIHDGYSVRRYRPRIESLFARIERWTDHKSGEIHWRSITRDNVTTLYGLNNRSRIFDPGDPDHPTRIFSWLICQSYDDKGNAIVYEYVKEDSQGIDLTQAHERNRTHPGRSAQLYLKRIKYGNRKPNRDTHGRATDPAERSDWMFEVVFDYGEGHCQIESPPGADPVRVMADLNPSGHWPVRQDPFSTYRAGFEVRTYRLCRRALLFHHFSEELGTPDCLVRSTEFTYAESPGAAFITQVVQSGYVRQVNGTYIKKSLPPLDFTYSQVPTPDELARRPVETVDPRSLENLPAGLDGSSYQWIDLHGEGIPGILSEQAGAWYYKRNLSPISELPVEFAPLEVVTPRPNLALAGGAQFLDLAGDGQPDLVMMDGPLPGLYEHDAAEGWQPFRSFTARLNRDMRDPNLKFVDLDGDGHADVLIAEDDAFVWHPSLAEDGFGPARRVHLAPDEEKGPRLVFADGTSSIYLADLSGDGLTDLVRIRNGEVCYWPNLGYGRFGPKVTMDAAPYFDNPDQFDPKRIRLADIDGSGTTDLIYLHRDGVRLYFNQSGNRWGKARQLNVFPRVDDLVSILPVDLFANGTACLVWSSPLPGDARRQIRYVNLMGGEKPHLLVKTANNLGAETCVSYAPSTKFYLQDRCAGKPWITRLPFPVHVVEKVIVTDRWRGTTFSSTYAYHHGYFDGTEREFRGFGRVDQVDCESYGEFESGNPASPYITPDKTLYQPPVKTVTWYHTGAALDREHILSQYEHEYFPQGFEAIRPGQVNVLGDFRENSLPAPDLDAENLSADEWREALRACKGMVLRQEIYELDVDALEKKMERPVKLYTSAYHNCYIRRVQARGQNRHAVFVVGESEAITYYYELDLTPETIHPDPRIAHTLNLKHDEYNHVLQSVAVVYPRIGEFKADLLPDSLALIHQIQRECHLAYTETRYTADFDQTDPDHYRLRVPCEVLTYELTGISPTDASDLESPDPRDNFYFTLDELGKFWLSPVHQTAGENVSEIAYHQRVQATVPEKRLVEHVRMLFFDDTTGVLTAPLPLGQLGRLGLPYETYKLALTEELLDAIFSDKLDKPIHGTSSARDGLRTRNAAGYLYDDTGRYWLGSGSAGFAPDAAQHFYLPERYTDPFGNVTTLQYDPRDLFVESSTDAFGNTTCVTGFDFRVLAPCAMKDSNDNLSEVYFDVLGLPVAMALRGKGDEADDLSGMTDEIANPKTTLLTHFFDLPDLDEDQARTWLGKATARYIYSFGGTAQDSGAVAWMTHPACVCVILREQHAKHNQNSPLQAAFEYSDGMGSVMVKKIQAEPLAAGQPLRWIASGKVILNNKGKPVKQYEPYFSQANVGHRFEEPREEGVTPLIYYDAVGRTVRTDMPDGSYSRVEFSPWHVIRYDPNDTAFDPDPARCSDWYRRRTDPSHPRFADFNRPENVRAAKSVEAHAGTPALTLLDSLGREVISIAHNRVRDAAGNLTDEKHLTFTRMDAEGKPLWIRDARGNLVMQYILPPIPDHLSADPVTGFVPAYDITGNLLFQHSMDGGDRWILNDAVGKPLFAWNSRGHIFRTDYDPLRRPLASFVTGADPDDIHREIQFEKIIYGDTPANGLSDAQKKNLNLRGKPYQHSDPAGIVTQQSFDFKGNLLVSTRQLAGDYKNTPDWSQTPALESEIFESSSRYDALNRLVTITSPDGSVYHAGFNAGNLLDKVDLNLRGDSQATPFVSNIDYNAKGQRTRIEYHQASHPILTEYGYDPDTFQLTRLVTTRPLYPDPEKRRLQDLAYTYDPLGNITHIADRAQPRIFFDNDCIDASSDYRYDPLYRLEAAKGREHKGQDLQPDWHDRPRMGKPIPYNCEELRNYVEMYRYDAVGNILQMDHHAGANLDLPGKGIWNQRYQYAPDSNRLLATSTSGDPTGLPDYTDTPGYHALYAYDPHGNMTRMPHLAIMEWDFKDQLHATRQQVVTGDGGEKTWYVYDAAGQRVRKVTERQTGTRKDERIYLGGFEIYRAYNGATLEKELERETLHIMDDKQRIALVETRTSGSDPAPQQLIRFQLGNHLGSAVLELDKTGEVISYEEYYPYGSTSYQAMQTEAPKRYRYTVKERDEENGLYYHGARYYAAWLARWIKPDPAGTRDSLSLYVYVADRPIQFRDLSGLQMAGPESRLMQRLEIAKQKGIPLDMVGIPTKDSPTWHKVLFGIEQRVALLGLAFVTAPLLGGAPLWLQTGIGVSASGYGVYATGTAGIELMTGKESGGGRQLELSERILAGVDLGSGIMMLGTAGATQLTQPKLLKGEYKIPSLANLKTGPAPEAEAQLIKKSVELAACRRKKYFTNIVRHTGLNWTVIEAKPV